MYHVNDTLLYGLHGVCRVADITQREWNGKRVDYYVLQPVYSDGSTFYVPVQGKTVAAKLRRALSAEEIRALIREMPREEVLWFDNEVERREKYKEMLARGDRRELVGIIKALHLHQQEQQAKGRHLHLSDEGFFRQAERLLYDEFALALGIQPDQVLPYILEELGAEEKKTS